MPFINNLMSGDKQFKDEILALKSQIQQLKSAIDNLKEDVDRKEVAIANLAREKAETTMQLMKQRRSNQTVLKQLEDERKFYFEEKEKYCQEINKFKKLKQELSDTTVNHPLVNQTAIEPYKKEIEKTKGTLSKILQANYNISIKFLRMKNTNSFLKDELKSVKLEHKKCSNDYKIKIDELTEKLNELVQEQLNTTKSCSSKKYLQLVKQNGCLVHENLNLQLQVDNLTSKYQKLKLEKTKSETNSRLTNYIKNESLNNKSPNLEYRRMRKKDAASTSASTSTNQIRSNDEEVLKLLDCHDIPGVGDCSSMTVSSKKIIEKSSEKDLPKSQATTSSSSVNVRNLVRVKSYPELKKGNLF